MDKRTLRRIIGEKKRAMTAQQIESASAELAEKLFAHPAYQRAEALYGYLSYNQEVRTAAILERAQQDGKRVAVPKVYGDTMKFLWLDDLEGHRMGYGGGFYDKYLSAYPGHPTLALCYGFQMLPHLETEAHDLPVDDVIWSDVV